MFRLLAKWVLKLIGWKVVGQFPHHLDKYLIIAIPHTSNWDFPLGILIRTSLDIDIRFIGKSSLFKPPFGFLFRWLGGIPVNRLSRNNFVDKMVEVIQREDKFITVIAPEGTRAKAKKLKSGFYYIAKGAEIPIVMIQFDYAHKQLKIREPFYPTDNMDADFQVIESYFRGIAGKIPEFGTFYP